MKMKKKAALLAVCMTACLLTGQAAAESGEPELDGVMVVAVPEQGQVTYRGRALLPGEGVPAEHLDELVCDPEAGAGFLPVYRDGTVGAVTALPPAAAVNARPEARDGEIVTYQNLAVYGVFPVRDDAAGCHIQLLTRPSMGMVTVENGTFVYTPYQNRTGEDRFTYAARDAAGVWSDEAEIRVDILQAGTAPVYGDLQGDAVAFAAARLAEAGVYTGPGIGGVHFFSPDETVSRGEFIAMTLAAAGREPVSRASASEAPDCVPAWSRGYVTAAVETGLIAGDEGGSLETGRPVTLAEAAVILSGAAGLERAAGLLHDGSLIPGWAAEAVARLEYEGFLSPELVEALGGDHTLTRRETAELLLPLLQRREQAARPTGLFSWITRD